MKAGRRILRLNDAYLVRVFFLDFLYRRKQPATVRTLKVGKLNDSDRSARRPKRWKARGRNFGAQRFEIGRYAIVLLQPGDQCCKRGIPSLVHQVWADLWDRLLAAYGNARLVLLVKFFDFLSRWGFDIPLYFLLNERFLRSEEHTSELQSRLHLVCRLLLEKKKNPRKPACP